MATPLTMYVPIKQEPPFQALALAAVDKFKDGVKAGLDLAGIVHYATLALVPNMPASPGKPPVGYAGILLMTNFDLAMDPYLGVFWDMGGGIKDAIKAIAMIAFDPVPPITKKPQFQKYINSVNLTPKPTTGEWTNFYQAYDKTVAQILPAKPTPVVKATAKAAAKKKAK